MQASITQQFNSEASLHINPLSASESPPGCSYISWDHYLGVTYPFLNQLIHALPISLDYGILCCLPSRCRPWQPPLAHEVQSLTLPFAYKVQTLASCPCNLLWHFYSLPIRYIPWHLTHAVQTMASLFSTYKVHTLASRLYSSNGGIFYSLLIRYISWHPCPIEFRLWPSRFCLYSIYFDILFCLTVQTLAFIHPAH